MHQNDYFELASSFVLYSNCNVFVTGRAGTGKTTFLKHIAANTLKKTAIVAPTGVAAINAGGVTMHSLFQLPMGMFIPSGTRGYGVTETELHDKHSLLANLKINAQKRAVLSSLELLIIDEVSMVRADMLDAVDVILRHIRKSDEAFGGLQMLFIGDLHQLPPVVQKHEETILQSYYASPFFFEAKALKEVPLVSIELQTIYRQNDPTFINLLNAIRNNTIDEITLDKLNQKYDPLYMPSAEEGYIVLSTHNQKADAINKEALEALRGKSYKYKAQIEGEFYEKAYPAEEVLELKEGAQVMFIKNDKGEQRKYYNGKIGFISRIEEEAIYVICNDAPDELKVEKEVWQNIRYQYEQQQDALKEEVLGSFTQYPLRLAWAITIHKSQGLTFEKAIIDAGASFAAGQVYVALSRLTSLSGLILNSTIHSYSIQTEPRIAHFLNTQLSLEALQSLLKTKTNEFVLEVVKRSFSLKELHTYLLALGEHYKEVFKEYPTTARVWFYERKQYLETVLPVVEKLQLKLAQLAPFAAQDQYQLFNERTNAAISYFSKELRNNFYKALLLHMEEMQLKKKTTTYVRSLKAIEQRYHLWEHHLKQAKLLADGIMEAKEAAPLLREVLTIKPKITSMQAVTKAVKESTKALSFRLFKEGKAIEDIAIVRSLTASTVFNHLVAYVEEGKMLLEEIIDEQKIKWIQKAIDNMPDKGLAEIIAALDNAVTYDEVRAVKKCGQQTNSEK